MNIPKHLINKINSIPTEPGIYKMIDSKGRIIYIGKSISLRNRVKSYFTKNHKWSKVEKMVSHIEDIQYQVTETHLEARLLECEMIKEIKPMFNAQFKNHEKYIYLKMEEDNISNPISIVHEREKDSFGPFRSKSQLMKLVDSLRNIFPITRVDNSYDFEYKLFPVELDKAKFEENRKILMEIFSDSLKLTILIQELEKKMKVASSLLQFGEAALYRDMAMSLNYVKSGLYNYNSLLSKDIILKLPIESGYKLFFVSKGQILLSGKYTKLSEKIIDEFISQGRSDKPSSPTDNDEKENLDFRDIIYSEIRSLAKDMVVLLD